MAEWFRWLIIASALVATVALWSDRNHIRATWTASTAAVAGVAWLLNIKHLSAAVSGEFYLIAERTARTNFGVVYGDFPELLERVALVVLIICGGALVFWRITRGAGQNPAGLAAALVVALVFFSTFANGLRPELAQSLAVVVIVCLAVFCEPGPGAVKGAALYGATLIIASAALLAFRPDVAVRPCGAKCGLLGELYTGAFVNENAFGLSLAITMPFILMGFKGWRRVALVVAMAAAAAGAESRTSQIAMVATLLTYLYAQRRSNQLAARTGAILAGAIALVVPVVTADRSSDAFTGRGFLWWVAIDGWKDSWLIGLGGPAWREIRRASAAVGDEAIYSPHSQWLDLLYAGGLLATLALVHFLLVTYRTAVPEDQVKVCVLVVAVMVVGVSERAWNFAAPDWLFWSILAACLVARREGCERSGPAPGKQRVLLNSDRASKHMTAPSTELSAAKTSELTAAKKRIRKFETELAVSQRAVELLKGDASPKGSTRPPR